MESLARKSRFIGIIALYALSIPAYSATGHMYAGASLAASYATIGHTSPKITYSSGVPIIDVYPIDGRTVSTSVVSINSGYEYEGANWMPAIALGLGFYTTPVNYDYNGHVIETVTGAPADLLYNYTYDITSTRVMAEVQFTWLMKMVSPFITLGAGPNWNRTNGYTESPLKSTGFVAQPPFQSNTTVNFAYQAGFGISTAFDFAKSVPCDFHHERISVGYRYVNLGQTSFGTRGPTYPYKLNTGSLTANDIYISYTHLF